MSALISVIIPVYNMELYLARCLNSVLGNTYRNLDVICVDDGSKDRSLDVLREYAEKDSRVVVIAKENGGVSSARNAGLNRMAGTFVTFIDPDDYVHPQYFELLTQAQQILDSDLTVCNYLSVENGDEKPEDSPVAFDPADVKSTSCSAFFQNRAFRSFCWGRLIKASAIQNIRFREDIRFAEDAVFTASVWESNPTLSCSVLDMPLYRYVQRGGSAVKMAGERDRMIVAKLFADQARLSPRNEEIYLEQTLRRVLNSRYYAVHIFPDDEVVRSCKEALRICMPLLRRTDKLSIEQKVRYTIFARLPFTYWLFRIKTDSGMWKWEKAERKKRRSGIE